MWPVDLTAGQGYPRHQEGCLLVPHVPLPSVHFSQLLLFGVDHVAAWQLGFDKDYHHLQLVDHPTSVGHARIYVHNIVNGVLVYVGGSGAHVNLSIGKLYLRVKCW